MNISISPRQSIIYILFISVLMDIGYGILDYNGFAFIPISLIFRATILIAFFVVLFRQNNFQAWFMKSIVVIWLFYMSFWAVRQGAIPLFHNINTFLRTIYVMCILLLVSNALVKAHRQGESVTDLLSFSIIGYGAIASLSIVFSFITGIGKLTYGGWAFGIKSFFVGGNDIGLAMLMGLIFSWIRFWQTGQWRMLGVIMFITFSVSLIGSRAAWGGVLGITICFVMAFLLFKKDTSLRTSILKVVIFVCFSTVGTYTTKLVYDNFDDLAFHVDKVTELMEGVSPRAFLEEAAWDVLDDRDLVDDIMGQGLVFQYKLYAELFLKNPTPTGGRKHSNAFREVEQDFLDLYGIYGVVLTSVFLLFHFYFWLLSWRMFWRRRSIEYFGCLMAVTLFLFHGLLAGHALISPQVCTLVGSIYAYLQFRSKQPQDEVKI
jgi:hypothetical protein